MNRQTLFALTPIMLVGGLLVLAVILTEQKSPDIALLRMLFCALFIAGPLMLSMVFLVGVRRYGKMWVIGKGWITTRSHPFTFRAVISIILLFLLIPMMIGILTAIRVIPFSVRIDGQTYVDPGPPSPSTTYPENP